MAPEVASHPHDHVVTNIKCEHCEKPDYDGNLHSLCLSCERYWLRTGMGGGHKSRYHKECLREMLLQWLWSYEYHPVCGWCDTDFDLGLLGPVMPDVVEEFRSERAQQRIVYVDRTYCHACNTWIRAVRGQDYYAVLCPNCQQLTCARCKEEYHPEDDCKSLKKKANDKNFKQYIIDTHLGPGGGAERIGEAELGRAELFEKCPEDQWQLCPACFRPVHERYMGADGANKTEFCRDCKGYCGLEAVREGMEPCYVGHKGYTACACGYDQWGWPLSEGEDDDFDMEADDDFDMEEDHDADMEEDHDADMEEDQTADLEEWVQDAIKEIRHQHDIEVNAEFAYHCGTQ
ncbi:hypothetical protein H2200_006048 [Cladophialophora chaetospira]|uniref:IBR domain-containing protein n=1 Tax=Cladophialophora chaetospira TaxID=386627 RepID=A0AA39CIX3_9EURO|nr:hypothetical protein H2200_006048 [Cladophialophora chaetospira]